MTADKNPYPCAGSCGRLLRPFRSDAAQWPGTRREQSHGMCFLCWRQEYRPVSLLRSCEKCGCITRPKTMKPGDAPEGSKYRVGALCNVCYKHLDDVTPDRVRYITGELLAYLRSRGREIPAELVKAVS